MKIFTVHQNENIRQCDDIFELLKRIRIIVSLMFAMPESQLPVKAIIWGVTSHFRTLIARFLYDIGVIISTYYVITWLRNFILNVKAFVLPRFSQTTNDFMKKYGSWAGATDGIGLAYAKELAARKLNLVLISRTEEKLRRVSAEIENEFAVETKIVVADFTEGRSVYKRIEDELKNLPIGILVNNVGVNAPYPLPVTEMTEDLMWEMVHVNCVPVLIMTKMVLPRMRKNRKGAIVNVSSMADMQPTPLIAVYSATKAFVTVFTKALQFENRKSGVTIQILSPGIVNTNMSHHLLPDSLITPNATDFVKQAIGTLGILDHTAGYPLHSILRSFLGIIPISLRTFLAAPVFELFRSSYKKIHDS